MRLRSPRDDSTFSGLCSTLLLICEGKIDSFLRIVNASLGNVKHLYCLLLETLGKRTPKIQHAAGKKSSTSQSKGTQVDPLRK